MLVEFSVKNFLSFRDKQTFRMVKFENEESNFIAPKNYAELNLYRTAAVFGPNASGKSNLLHSLNWIKMLVTESAMSIKSNGGFPVTHFKLDKISSELPSEFDILFIADNVLYQLGLCADSEKIHEEWLNMYKGEEIVNIYSRAFDGKNNTYDWNVSPELSENKDLWIKATRNNSMFISTAVQLNCEFLLPVYKWFDNVLATVDAPNESLPLDYTTNLFKNNDGDDILNLIYSADLNISDVKIKNNKILMLHKNDAGENVYFDLNEESNGTIKLFSYAGFILNILKEGHVLIFDELCNNLHPIIQKFIVELFQKDEYNNKCSQLIFSTHDTSILNSELFNPGQIWFCEKDQNQSTLLRSLADFEVDDKISNIELAYLQGRFGGIPVVGPLELRG